ncbi:lysozyme inhibitor LprI family protein [Novosphingobium sp.]|uniref:lysozyme inhibitor LprI family protein n=1 Tax=Novosphingobium sp. TaxID=1874826 RepID=UPI003BAB7441
MLAAVPVPVCVETPQTNYEIGQCSAVEVIKADQRMTAAWRKPLKDVGGSKTQTGQTLLVEQRAWIAFREKACQEYQNPDLGRDAQIVDGPMCVANIINDRAKDLESRYQLNHQDQINP